MKERWSESFQTAEKLKVWCGGGVCHALTIVGYPTDGVVVMPTATKRKSVKTSNVRTKALTVKDTFIVTADAKKRISLRGTEIKHFHVQARSDGSFLLEPRVLVPPSAVSTRTLAMLDRAATNFKKGRASAPVDLSEFSD